MTQPDIIKELSKQLSLQVEIYNLPGDRAQCDEVYYVLRRSQIFARQEGFRLPKEVGYISTTIATDIMNHPDFKTCSSCNSVFLMSKDCPVCKGELNETTTDEERDSQAV